MDDLSKALVKDEEINPLMNRVETKFFLPASQLQTIINAIKNKLTEGDIDSSSRYSRNQTIYLDNRDLDSFRDNLEGIKPRFKVRIRRYNNNDRWEDTAFVELKIKLENGMTKKTRVRIPAGLIPAVENGEYIPLMPIISMLNADVPKQDLWKRLAAINSVISKYNYKKQVVVEYNRRAFSSNEVRVTIDDSLMYKDFKDIEEDLRRSIIKSDGWKKIKKPVSKIMNNDFLILEVKHQESGMPKWIKKIVEKTDAQEIKFSKYAAAVVTHLTSSKNQGIIQRQKDAKIKEAIFSFVDKHEVFGKSMDFINDDNNKLEQPSRVEQELAELYSDLLELDAELQSDLVKGPNYWKDKDPAKYKKMLSKLKRERKTPGSKERGYQQVLQAKRREKGGSGTTAGQNGHKGHSGGHMKTKTGTAVKRYASAEKKHGAKMSLDRKDNGKGYESGNVRLAPQSLNRGDENNKKKKEWYKKNKK